MLVVTDVLNGNEIFISHASPDAAMASEVRDLLQQLGYATWIAPDDLVGASSWPEQILAAVGRCHALVVLLSDAANRSDHVAREVSIAADAHKPLVPLRLAPVEPDGSLRYLLHLSQWIDVFPPPVAQHGDRVRAALEGGGVVRRLVTRKSRSNLWVAIAAVAAAAIGAIAWLATRHDDKAATSHLLADVPTSVSDWSELDTVLGDLAAAEGLASGDDVRLVPVQNADDSVAFKAPSTWTDVEGTVPFQDANGNTLGDLLVVSIQRSSFDGGRAGGLFVGAAPIATLAPNGLDDFQPRQFFSDLGCVSSPLIELREPFGGQVRLWSDCNNTPRIYISALYGTGEVTAFVFGLVTTRQEAAAIMETLMSLEIDGTPLA